jgi:hypothetical protein
MDPHCSWRHSLVRLELLGHVAQDLAEDEA